MWIWYQTSGFTVSLNPHQRSWFLCFVSFTGLSSLLEMRVQISGTTVVLLDQKDPTDSHIWPGCFHVSTRPFSGFSSTSKWGENWGRPRTHWRDYISDLACELFGIPRRSWRMWLGRMMSGLPCLTCYHHNPDLIIHISKTVPGQPAHGAPPTSLQRPQIKI